MRAILPMCAALLLLLQGGATVAAEPDLSIDGMSVETAGGFLQGAALALAYVNFKMALENKPQLYCDENLGPSAGEFYDLADSKLTGPHESLVVVMAALDALRERYPCS